MSNDTSWRSTIDRWMRNPKIRRDTLIALLAALLMVLITLILLAKIAAAVLGTAALVGTGTRMTRKYLTRRRRRKAASSTTNTTSTAVLGEVPQASALDTVETTAEPVSRS